MCFITMTIGFKLKPRLKANLKLDQINWVKNKSNESHMRAAGSENLASESKHADKNSTHTHTLCVLMVVLCNLGQLHIIRGATSTRYIVEYFRLSQILCFQ